MLIFFHISDDFDFSTYTTAEGTKIKFIHNLSVAHQYLIPFQYSTSTFLKQVKTSYVYRFNRHIPH